jgi:hypothetical protein
MPLVPPARCPTCGSVVSLRELWEVAPTSRYSILWNATGVTCPHCLSQLRVTQGVMKVVTILTTFVPPFIFVIWYKKYDPPAELAGLIAIAGLFIAIPTAVLFPRRFARLRRAEPDEKLLYPLEHRAE